MEARMGSKSHHLCGSDAPDFMLREMDLMGIGKKNREWDSNDWKWDGDLFVASPLNPAPLDCRSKQFIQFGAGVPSCGGDSSNSSSSCSDEANLEDRQGKREHEKRRRVVVGEENEMNGEVASLSLKLGGHVYPIMETVSVNWEEKTGKKTPPQGPSSSRTTCQVEGCGADLSNARDYHRRHKVCEMHSKATNALVGNFMQRFCQQCSRFHVLQEFDEDKRSCRRRLAGHNRRRRKTHPDAVGAGNSLNDDRVSSYLLITLLRILSNLHSNNSSEPKDQDLLTHLLRNFTNFAGATDSNNLSGLLQVSQALQGNGIAVGKSPATPNLLVNGANSVSVEESMRPSFFANNMSQGAETETHVARPSSQLQSTMVPAAGLLNKETIIENSDRGIVEAAKPANSLHIRDVTPLRKEASHSKHISAPESILQRANLSDIDLNNIYIDTQEFPDGCERMQPSAELRVGSLDSPSCAVQDNQQLSPPQASGNSDSGSAQSPTSSSGDAQSRTDRIVFKLFGKDPTNFPLVLRSQIFDWLSHSPTEIEGYIRPGCIILTIYLRLAETKWEELSCDLRSSLYRLLDVADDTFWRTGWVYARIHHQMAFIYNGQVVLDTSLPASSLNHCRISSVTPIAIPVSERARFTVKGTNVCHSTTRLLCAFENEYLLPEMSDVLVGGTDSREDDEVQCISFSCSLPNLTGRGFIEVEDDALGSSFFPFIVGEQNLCSEIRTLEGVIGANSFDETGHKRTDITRARNQAMDFLHEMGWLLRRSRLWSRSNLKNAHLGSFPLKRFKWLMEFSMDHDWCAVVKKLLDVLLDGAVDLSGHSSVELVLLEMSLLHRAVRRNCRPMVELLLRYVPEKTSAHPNQGVGANSERGYLFRPDMEGPSGVTPLHVAASRDDTENVLDALTDDPGQVGVVAWRSARDNSGFAPEDYARLRGYYTYIHLVRKKINKKSEVGQGHVIVNIPSTSQKQIDSPGFTKPAVLQKHKVGLVPRSCKVCDQHLVYGNTRRSLPYRPLVLSVVAIAAVCVCVSLLFHGPPEVLYVFRPFRWELLEYGSE